MGFLRRRAHRHEEDPTAPEAAPDAESGVEDAPLYDATRYDSAAYDVAPHGAAAYEAGSYEEAEIEPFVPVAADESGYAYVPGYDAESNDSIAQDGAPPIARRRRVRLPRPHLTRPKIGVGVEMRSSTPLLLAVALIAAGIFGTLLNLGEVNGDIETWWPAVVIGVALVWMLIALIRRQVASFLGGSALAGVGLSLLLSTQDIASFRDTLLGLGLVTIGLGIVIRGFLLRQQTPL